MTCCIYFNGKVVVIKAVEKEVGKFKKASDRKSCQEWYCGVRTSAKTTLASYSVKGYPVSLMVHALVL